VLTSRASGPVETGPSKLLSWPGFVVLAVLFGLSYAQFPLFYETQNQYFFRGLVQVGIGLLRDDWLAGSRDTWPVFTSLVTLTSRLDVRLFYVYFVLLLGVYAYAMLGIASSVRLLDGSNAASLTFLAVLAALHSPLVGALSSAAVGFNLGEQLTTGVALQDILGSMLQPSTFGALLLLSIFYFLRERPYRAVVASSLAATIHPTYILTAAVVTLSYVVLTVRRGGGALRAVRLGLWALVLTLPVLVYVYTAFHPTSPSLTAEARSILVHFRFPHHAFPDRWLGPIVAVKLGVTLLALYLMRRTELAVILLTLLGAAVGLTVLQVLTRSDGLALLFPWRLSVFLVPVSTAVLSAYVLSRVLGWLKTRGPVAVHAAVVGSVVILIGLAVGGVVETRHRFAVQRSGPRAALMEFVRTTKTPGAVYLIPPYWDNFRLRTGAPVVSDWDFIPYNDVAVIEWHARFRQAEAFYKARGEARCQVLGNIRATYRVTHVVLWEPGTEACGAWRELFRAADHRLYAVAP